jgi:hypothetical protein
MKFRIWHNSNLGHAHFERDVPDVDTAKQWLRLLADYDLYQGDRVLANAQGLLVWNEKEQEWEDWEREEDGESITHVIDEEDQKESAREFSVEKALKAAAKVVAPKLVKVSREELSRRKMRR